MIEGKVIAYAKRGYHVIVNETIRVNDGGFSGVLLGSLMEGAPNETPRCVESAGCMRLPRSIGFRLIKAVYGFDFHIPYQERSRVEFSIHPNRVGYHRDFQILWQEGLYDGPLPTSPRIEWPNKYSRAMGDKAFGILIGHLLGMPVPRTTVFGRNIPQFTFGTPTNCGEPAWIRTAPRVQCPGQFTTKRGQADPFAIMSKDDPDGTLIAAMLFQDGVAASYSGSAITGSDGKLVVEGCGSYGDGFMVGIVPKGDLPERVREEALFLGSRLREELGDVRYEWVFDGEKAWLVQLHTGRVETLGDVIYPGEPDEWLQYEAMKGLEGLRKMVREREFLNGAFGIELMGDVGLTSHFGDLLRKAKVPSKITRPVAVES